MLRRLGLDASGIDASPKMIQKARTNSVTCGVTVEYILGDYMNMSKRFSEGFDLITCLGDTVAHVRSGQDLRKLFQEVYKSLNPGGLFVIQARNYDFIMKHQARFTPPTGSRNGTEETLFFRLLDFNPKTLNLSIAKFRWHENRWESSVYTTEIHPYLKKELESALKSVGFAKLDSYRNYNFEDYDPERFRYHSDCSKERSSEIQELFSTRKVGLETGAHSKAREEGTPFKNGSGSTLQGQTNQADCEALNEAQEIDRLGRS